MPKTRSSTILLAPLSPDAGEPGHAGSVVRAGLRVLKQEEARVEVLRVAVIGGALPSFCDLDAFVARKSGFEEGSPAALREQVRRRL